MSDELKAAHHWFHIPAQFIVASFCVYWYWHPPAPSKAVLVLTGVTVVMALLDMRPSHKAVYLLLVFCLMFIENRAINRDRSDAAALEDRRRTAENKQFQTIADGLTASIRQGQEEFNATMAGITRDMNTVTGGDSFCYIAFTAANDTGGYPAAVHQGKYPLYGVQARVVDMAKEARIHPPGQLPTIETIFAGQSILQIGDLAKGTATVPFPFVAFESKEAENFNIFFSAHNGLWDEILRLRKVSGQWVSAIKVTRFRVGKSGKSERYTIFQQVDSKYPRINGVVDWN